MIKPLVGQTYPTVTSETQTEAWRRLHKEWPNMLVWSHYYDSTKLPTWTEAWFTEAPANVTFLVSIKHSDVQAIGTRIAAMPEHLRGRMIIILHHEPDQWRSATDPRSDPAPDVWWKRQVDFLNMRDVSQWKTWVRHMVVYTEDRARTDPVFWESNWGRRWDERIDFMGWDCFNIGRSITRPGADIFKVPLEQGRRRGVKIVIREFGQVTPVDSPQDSEGVANQIEENWEYALAQNEIDDIFYAIVWYNNHNNTLSDPNGLRRPLTTAVVKEMTLDANTPDEIVPDPTHPQYRAGWNAREALVPAEIDRAEAVAFDAGQADVVRKVQETIDRV